MTHIMGHLIHYYFLTNSISLIYYFPTLYPLLLYSVESETESIICIITSHNKVILPIFFFSFSVTFKKLISYPVFYCLCMQRLHM